MIVTTISSLWFSWVFVFFTSHSPYRNVLSTQQELIKANKAWVLELSGMIKERPTLIPVAKSCYAIGQSEAISIGAYCGPGTQACIENPCPPGSSSKD